MEEEKVSGNIYVRKDKYEKLGESYYVKIPSTGQRIGMYVSYLNPEDLIALADRIEKMRKKEKNNV